MISPSKMSSLTAAPSALDGNQSSPALSARTPSIERRVSNAAAEAGGKPQLGGKEALQQAMSVFKGLAEIFKNVESMLRGAVKLAQDVLNTVLDLLKSGFDTLKTAMSSMLSLIK